MGPRGRKRRCRYWRGRTAPEPGPAVVAAEVVRVAAEVELVAGVAVGAGIVAGCTAPAAGRTDAEAAIVGMLGVDRSIRRVKYSVAGVELACSGLLAMRLVVEPYEHSRWVMMLDEMLGPRAEEQMAPYLVKRILWPSRLVAGRLVAVPRAGRTSDRVRSVAVVDSRSVRVEERR